MEDYLAVLKNEFEAGEQSFLLKVRVELDWDRIAFNRLVTAMHTYCIKHADEDYLERWIAQGFWYIPRFTRDWSTHPLFPQTYGQEYYDKAYEQLDDLAYWFFVGQSPYIETYPFEPLT